MLHAAEPEGLVGHSSPASILAQQRYGGARVD